MTVKILDVIDVGNKVLAALAALLIIIGIGIGVALWRGGIPTVRIGEFELVWGTKPEGPSMGAPGAPRQDTQNTVWESQCEKGTTVISGTCIIAEYQPSVPLRNIGPNFDKNQWECTWAGRVAKANVRAVCTLAVRAPK
jgi:hypothetical protein